MVHLMVQDLAWKPSARFVEIEDFLVSELASARLTLVLSADGKLHALITKQFAFVCFILWGAFFGTFALMLPKPLVVSKNLATFPTRQRWFTGLHHLRVGRCICDCWDLTENHLKELYSPFLCVTWEIVLWMLVWNSAFTFLVCLHSCQSLSHNKSKVKDSVQCGISCSSSSQ